MGPSSLKNYEEGTPLLRRILSSAQHFMIDQNVFDTVTSIQKSAAQENVWAFDAALPAEHCVIEFETSGVVIYSRGPGDTVNVRMPGFLPAHVWDHPIASYSRGVYGPEDIPVRIHKEAPASHVDPQLMLQAVHAMDILFSLIAEPRLTTMTPPPRPARRRAQRVLKGVVPAWNVVTWRVDAPTKPKNSDAQPGTRMPLHFCRAHWMHGEEGWPKAVQRPGKPGWWVWRRHSWKGHPDFGVKLHRYRPRLDEDPKRKIGIVPTISSETALDATNAAGQSAVAQWEDKETTHG